MKKKVIRGICILLAIILLIPIPSRLKDGGTIVKILGIEVFNNVE